ncbi:MAG: hypothetical protein J6K41_01440 [Paraprevotella sp.]|nr:hypothetical protein [Paraprevotella sp.]
MRVFVDTNLLIDFVCNRDGSVEQAQSLFALGYMGRLSLLTCALSYINAVYIGRKYDKASVIDKLFRMSAFVEVVDLKGTVVVDALRDGWADYEDASQYETAVAGNGGLYSYS